jgi:3-isopropylmalate dehydrogenase
MQARVVLLPGDGIGPEVVAEARRVLEEVALRGDHTFEFEEHLIGGAAIEAEGTPLPPGALAACRSSDAILLGSVGGPQWDDPTAPIRPEQGLLELRKELQVFANLRPVRLFPSLVDASPLRAERLDGVDLMVVRELTGGLYFGQPRLREQRDGELRAVDTLEYTDHEIRRVVRLAFRLAERRRRLVTSIDKANVLETSRLWRQVASEVGEDFPDVELEHQLVDSGAMRLVTDPGTFDVIVTGNMFGDILTDEAAVLSGSLGLLPSASLGDGPPGLYEPVHGSAPDIAGRGLANPIGCILSTAMMLRHSLALEEEAAAVEGAVGRVLDDGARTADLGGTVSTREMGDLILEGVR